MLKVKNSFFELHFLIIFFFLLTGFTLFQNIFNLYSEHYSVLAHSFVKGHLDLIANRREKFLDTNVVDGKYYFSADPGTAFFLYPLALIFSFFGAIPPQWPLNFLALLLISKSLGRIFTSFGINPTVNRLWLTITFFWATSMVSIIFIPNSWNLAQTVAITLVTIYLSEWLTSRRIWLLVALIVILTFTRRQMIIPLSIFSLLDLWLNSDKKRKTRYVTTVILVAVFFLSYILNSYWNYHFFRKPAGIFGVSRSHALPVQEKLAQRYGVFNFHYIPKNIYLYFFRSFDPVYQTDFPDSSLKWPFILPSPDGTSFFYIAPIFLFLFLLPLPPFKIVAPYLAATGSLLVLYLSFFTSGQEQFGLRYSADMVPFLFVPLILTLKNHLSVKTKFLIASSCLFNGYLLISFFAFGRTL